MPTKINSNEIWDIFYPNTDFEETLDVMIDEMSTMGGGAVTGTPNKYNPYKHTQLKRPKVKRAKRQRRK